MKLKRILYAAVAGILCLSLVACGNTGAISDGDDPQTSDDASASADPTASAEAPMEEKAVEGINILQLRRGKLLGLLKVEEKGRVMIWF